MKYRLPILIAFSAILVSGTAAYYSVTGLGKLFAGAAVPVMVMASSLEISKLVTASLLYRYWTTLSALLKTYLTVAVAVLILITSLGIYGFLTAAYQQTSGTMQVADTEITLYQNQKDIVQLQVDQLASERVQLANSISELRTGLSKNVIQYTDTKGNLITSTSSATRNALEKQLASSTIRLENLDSRLDEQNSRLLGIQTKIAELQVNQISAGELGPLKYISALSGIPVDSVVNYLVLAIVFVFDPLAIALVIAANFAFKQISLSTVISREPSVQLQPVEEVKTDINKVVKVGVDDIKPKLPKKKVRKKPKKVQVEEPLQAGNIPEKFQQPVQQNQVDQPKPIYRNGAVPPKNQKKQR
jgi:hypothetical protein